MKVVILCGGKGTRLREETEFQPKPLVEIGGRPILWHIMKMYSHQGFSEFVLCLGQWAWKIKEYFLNYQTMNCDFTIRPGPDRAIDFHGSPSGEEWRITLADTGQDTMTGARVRQIAKYLPEGKDFMLTYGDGLADIDLHALLAFHRAHGRLATLTAVRHSSRFGELQIDDRNLVSKFAEKPGAQTRNCIAGGFFVFKYDALDYFSDDPDSVLEREPLERLVRDGQLAAYPHNGYWQCMDTQREWVLLNKQWAGGAARWAIWGKTKPRRDVLSVTAGPETWPHRLSDTVQIQDTEAVFDECPRG
jgi:glucose-1-phosphate cytidylyltransferase